MVKKTGKSKRSVERDKSRGENISDPTWDLIKEPNRSALSSGVTLLDGYIERHFQKDRQFGAITILRRRD